MYVAVRARVGVASHRVFVHRPRRDRVICARQAGDSDYAQPVRARHQRAGRSSPQRSRGFLVNSPPAQDAADEDDRDHSNEERD
jgi:hypothetical protein